MFNGNFLDCKPGTLSSKLVRGKAIFCWRVGISESLEVRRTGGIATVLGNAFHERVAVCQPYLIPSTIVSSTINVHDYIKSNRNLNVKLIQPKTIIGTEPAPFMARFTARGSSAIQPNILKPDIAA
ncbi:unnamed protein product [Fraxinus pennsylvanica]|uniref:Uncharacterized protein n=1 Tax=Fraxinus pennsylvanica TaxID=56036 RepID=A0AAD2EFU3_9LAMI|nr:unnamed protein product [Fraxinus pennsylvanica]